MLTLRFSWPHIGLFWVLACSEAPSGPASVEAQGSGGAGPALSGGPSTSSTSSNGASSDAIGAMMPTGSTTLPSMTTPPQPTVVAPTGTSGPGVGGMGNDGGASSTPGASGSMSMGGSDQGGQGQGGSPVSTPSGGTGVGGFSAGGSGGVSGVSSPTLQELQRAHIELRFGMFIHFGILTYTGQWADANLDIDQFNPTDLDPGQWADAAVSAGMKYGVLTTRHHDGFALWDSAVSDFDTGSISWRNGEGDVVAEFVDAFRSRGLQAGLYYSVWDTTQGVGNDPGNVTRAQIDYVKAQITELLTNYGPISILVFDGWSWKMGHQAMPYQEIRELVKSLQPECLMMDHTHFMSPWDGDIAAIEEPKGAFAPEDNTYPATQGQKIVDGNDWFWAPNSATQDPMTLSDIVQRHLELLEPRWTNFLLNCPPDRSGRMSQNIVDRLAEVGNSWSSDASRPPLPEQGPWNEYPYTPLSASASSGHADSAIDGINDWGYYTVWESQGALPQSVTLDLGETKPDVGILNYVPRYVANMGPSTDGAILDYAVSVSVDGDAFTEVTSGSWPLDGRMKVAPFEPTSARYVRLTAVSVGGQNAAATEVTVGAVR